MKKRILSALLVLCLACGLVSTAWATGQSTPETAAVSVTDAASGETAQEEPLPDETAGEPASDETVEGTAAPVADGTEYTAALDVDGQTLNVIVTAPDGAFAEGVDPQLSVTMLAAEDELNAVAGELDKAQVEYDGFAAMDITFTDKITGEEIEPAQQVSVRIELPQAIVDSGIDLNTLAVQHLEEDADGNVQNVTEVATLDNGITLSEEAAAAANEVAGVAPMSDLPAEEATAGDAAETPAAVAEFEVDGFSSFVITWTDSGNDAQINVVIRDIDTRQEVDIPGFDSSYWNNKLRNEETVTVQDIISHLDTGDYEYANKATYTIQNGQEQQFSSVRARRTREGWSGSKRYYFYFNGSNDYVRVYESNATIYLYYTKSDSGETPGGDQGGTTTTNATVTTSKSAYLKNDNSGNYDLTLSISGDRGSSSKKQKVDVLFILDESNSMMEWWSDDTRLAHAKDAIEHITGYGNNDGLSDNTNLDVQYALVGFYGGASNRRNPYNDATVLQKWTSSANELCDSTPDWLNDQRQNGGTNYEAGIRTGKEVLAAPGHRSDALTVVIFITDGNPGYYYDNDGKTAGTGDPGNSYNSTALANAVSQLKTLDTDYFYLVGVTNNISTDVFQQMENAVDVPNSNKDSISAKSPQDLLKAFEDIQEQITFFAATDVTITDPLSQYADIVLNADEKAEFTVTVTRTELTDDGGTVTSEAKTWTETVAAGEEVKFQDRAGNDVTVTPAYNNRTITLTFPHSIGETTGYELEPGYTYSISTVIAPSDKAKQEYAASKEYPETPDDNTGTHSIPDEDNNNGKDKGFWSNDNDNAKVTFTANGEDGSQAFPKPVIQVTEEPTGSLQIVKDVQGIDNTDSSSVANTTFTFQIEKVELDENDNYVTDTEFNDDDLGFVGGVKSGVTIQGESETVIRELPEGTYRVTETAPPAINANKYNGPTVSYTVNQIVTITKDNTAEIQVTNTYNVKTFSLTVEKNVTGNLGDTNQDFTFTVTGINAGEYSGTQTEINPDTKEEVKTPITVQVTGVNGKLQFKLKDGQSVTFESLPYGTQCSVVEDEVTGYEQNANCVGSGVANGRNYTNEGLTADTTVTFTNHKELVGPPTGLERNDTPYTILVTVAGIAGLALIGGIVARRRHRRME